MKSSIAAVLSIYGVLAQDTFVTTRAKGATSPRVGTTELNGFVPSRNRAISSSQSLRFMSSDLPFCYAGEWNTWNDLLSCFTPFAGSCMHGYFIDLRYTLDASSRFLGYMQYEIEIINDKTCEASATMTNFDSNFEATFSRTFSVTSQRINNEVVKFSDASFEANQEWYVIGHYDCKFPAFRGELESCSQVGADPPNGDGNTGADPQNEDGNTDTSTSISRLAVSSVSIIYSMVLSWMLQW